jgi:hypothetical protein
MNNFFFDTGITVSESFLESLNNFIKKSDHDRWQSINNLTVMSLPIKLFETETVLNSVVNKFGAGSRLSVFRTNPYEVYSWHTDYLRNTCLNILLDGYDSMTLFANNRASGVMTDLITVPYSSKKVFLLNVQKNHTVLNFNNVRYLLSIGIPKPADFQDVKNYINELLNTEVA